MFELDFDFHANSTNALCNVWIYSSNSLCMATISFESHFIIN